MRTTDSTPRFFSSESENSSNVRASPCRRNPWATTRPFIRTVHDSIHSNSMKPENTPSETVLYNKKSGLDSFDSNGNLSTSRYENSFFTSSLSTGRSLVETGAIRGSMLNRPQKIRDLDPANRATREFNAP